MEQNLKHRLTGAIILVSLAVIFIPVILEGPDNEWTPLSHGIPEPPRIDYKADLDPPQPVIKSVPAKPADRPVQKPAYKLAEPAKKKAIAPVPMPAPTVPENPAIEILTGWFVQVGSFSQELNASGLSKRLELSGYESRLQNTSTETGRAWRVMIGPSKNRGAAEKLRDKLASEHQLKGIVINNPG